LLTDEFHVDKYLKQSNSSVDEISERYHLNHVVQEVQLSQADRALAEHTIRRPTLCPKKLVHETHGDNFVNS